MINMLEMHLIMQISMCKLMKTSAKLVIVSAKLV